MLECLAVVRHIMFEERIKDSRWKRRSRVHWNILSNFVIFTGLNEFPNPMFPPLRNIKDLSTNLPSSCPTIILNVLFDPEFADTTLFNSSISGQRLTCCHDWGAVISKKFCQTGLRSRENFSLWLDWWIQNAWVLINEQPCLFVLLMRFQPC